MVKKLKLVLKNVIVGIICATSVTSALLSCIPTAKADSSSILGTNAALGSPVLNDNFTLDNWNKWEMICWGVYLSNFCQPLIDTYETAFSSGTGGSNGAGYKALCFGSGSDQQNNETIQDLCDYAINIQNSTSKKEIYVSYTKLENGVLGDKIDPNTLSASEDNSSKIRTATFKDFFFKNGSTENVTSITYTLDAKYTGYEVEAAKITSGYIPTFYIRSGSGKYTVLLDYTDQWDVQVISVITNAVRTGSNSDYSSQFSDAYISYTESNSAVGMDCFGNIVMSDGKMLMPACVNQNITKTKTINVLNSWMMNGYVTTYSSDAVVQGLHQNTTEGLVAKILAGGLAYDAEYGGLPAFGKSSVGSVGMFYYDLDTIVHSKYKDSSETVNYGEVLIELFNLDITSNKNKYPIKFEIAGNGVGLKVDFDTIFNKDEYNLGTTILASSMIPNIIGTNETQPEILSEIIDTNGDKISLFSENPVAIAVQVVTDDEDSGGGKNGKALRAYYNWLYQVYSGKNNETTSGSLESSQLKAKLETQVTSISDLRSVTKDTLWDYFKASYPEYKDNSIVNTWLDAGNNESISDGCARVCLAYPVSNTMKAVSQVLSIQDGTEFSVYCTKIYMTYLDFYGIANQTTMTGGTTSTSNFNTDIYDESSDILNVDIGEITDVKSAEEMEDEVLQMSYLMLHPEDGRSYRKELMYSGISDFLYEQYNRIVFGGESSTYSGTSTKSNSGFLAVPTFSENFLTSWFLDNYTDIAIILIMACIVAMVIIGLLKGRKISWYILSVFTIVNVILIIPSTGEITPYITSSITQKVFSSKMTYWEMSEGIANASIESDSVSQSGDMSDLSAEEAETVNRLINSLSVIYTDRSLMLKQDVSQKLTQELSGVYTSIQIIQSARWILPMVMQQFSADEQQEDDYVYVKLSNVWDDASNLYWYYNPEDAEYVTKSTLTSDQFKNETASTADSLYESIGGYGLKSSHAAQYYIDYVSPEDNWADDESTTINYANYSYTLNNSMDDIVHTYSFILHDNTLGMGNGNISRSSVFGTNNSDYVNANSWQNWIDTANDKLSTQKKHWSTNKESTYGYEFISDTYDRTDVTSLEDGYSYYKTTESPFYYFFNVVKDSFPSSKTIGAVIGRIQGEIEEDSDGNEVRSNFMYATKTSEKESEDTSGRIEGTVEYTGLVRDVLDLQCFFTNTIPYMYEMTLASGGFDGESGLLGDDTITEESQYYEGNLQSWAYRCNWAVKLMENPNLSKSMKVRDSSGNKYTVTNPMLPDSYPENRPMIFSEAQMYALGLEESDLNLVELKCIEVNNQVAKSWTLLLNYAGTSGITKEVFFRVMATDATQIFCQEFSSGGILDNRYNLYPQSIDLRYLSFDAVMKMLMINVSKNTNYVYGDTMSTVLEESDLVTAMFLFVCAVLCTWLIPLCQQIIMAAIFYLGFIAIIRALFSSAKYKGKIAGGQLINNIMFMVYTIVYYMLIAALMAISSSDEVLTVQSVSTNPGNPVWMLLAVILISIVYIILMYQQLRFCFAHYRDMGAEVIGFVTGTVIGGIQDAIGNAASGLSNMLSGEESSSSSRSSSSINRTESSQTINTVQSSNVNVTNDSSYESYENISLGYDDISDNSYNTGENVDNTYNISSDDIDAEIKAGKEMKDNK